MTSSLSEPIAAGILSARPIDGERRVPVVARPTQPEAEAAVRTLIAWLGDDPERADLQGTPARVATAFYDLFTGYRTDPVAVLRRSLMPEEAGGQLVMLRSIRFVSFCERHFLQIIGHAHVAYVPRRHAVGIGAIAAAVDAVTRRLQIQERMTHQIAEALAEALDPEGVAVVVEAEHQCMTARGVSKVGARFVTSRQLGCLAPDTGLGRAFFQLIGQPAQVGVDQGQISAEPACGRAYSRSAADGGFEVRGP
jgi:GTP cyclohydrolase I